MKLQVQIICVDSYGFNGREFHPAQSDIGMTGHVVSSHTEFLRDDGECFTSLNVDDAETVGAAIAAGTPGVYSVYLCRMSDGTFRELLDFEVRITPVALPNKTES